NAPNCARGKRYMNMRGILLGLLALLPNTTLLADETKNSVHLDDGILRWQSGEEVALFGVNYNAPFAFTYRAIDRSGVDHEGAIPMAVEHVMRLGVEADRVPMWEREISDKEGNLLENEHLRLFDFLIAELKKDDVKNIITALRWWGSGYPEPGPEEPGFSTQY